MSRPPRPCAPRLPALAFLLLAAVPAAAAASADHPGRWGFGWDPGDSGRGLTVRHRFLDAWDLSVAAGPDDFRTDTVRQYWDDDDVTWEDGVPRTDSDRREQGWVRLAAGRRFWRDGRLAVSGVAGVTYRWSVEELRGRDVGTPSGSLIDYRNRRETIDTETWTLTLGIRPSVAVTPRMQVEFEAGLEFERRHSDSESLLWWDSYAQTDRSVVDLENRTFSSYGGFEFAKLKFIFWF